MTGILEISEESYHAGPDERPCLSASIAHILCSQSPKHAWTAHPRLNPGYERKEEDRFNVGNVAHAMLLEGRDIVYVIHADTYRTNEAKEAREYARSIGKVPLLASQRADVEAMVSAVQGQLATYNVQPALFTDGKPEQSLVWEEAGVLCKARLDWLREDYTTIDDLKTTSRSADPQAYSRALYATGGDIQVALYLRGVRALTGMDAWFRWCVVETYPPYALRVIEPGADMLTLGNAKVERALAKWRKCLEFGEWPAYPADVAIAQMPPWEEAKFLASEEVAA